MLNHSSLADHVVSKIENAEVYTDPFPHLYIRNVFPDDVFADMVRMFPTKRGMKPLSNMYANRFVANFDKHSSPGLGGIPAEEQRKFWQDFSKFILGKRLQEVFFHKYKEFVSGVYWEHCFPTARLSIDYQPYSIGAHRDRDDKLASVMFYIDDLPLTEIKKNYGTALLTPKDPNMKIDDQHYNLKLFNLEKIALYEQNALFSWPVRHNSFHGVYPLKYNIPRRTIGYFIKNTVNTKGRFNGEKS